ncbi:MAG: nucleotide exchange factor GrpE [Candidatus Peribacteria bacterium]|nr:nucleotide exchange factor GrpE [Candidatus Peribacteria bacterium]
MPKHQDPQDTSELQDILQELEKEQETKDQTKETEEKAVSKIARLEAQLTEKEEITKKAQIDYINLKADFDFLLRQTKLKEENLEQDTLIKVVKKLLPFVEDLRKSLLHLSDQQKTEALGKGVQMVYDKFISALAELSIFPIDTLGGEPDTQLHEPVSIQPTTEKKLKGKVVQIFEQGFYYKKGDNQIVILPSKVVI